MKIKYTVSGVGFKSESLQSNIIPETDVNLLSVMIDYLTELKCRIHKDMVSNNLSLNSIDFDIEIDEINFNE